MLDDDDGVAVIDQPVQHLEEQFHVGHVQADRRLLQQIERRFRLAHLAAGARSARGRRRASVRVTSLSRCASPPLKVGLGWPSLR